MNGSHIELPHLHFLAHEIGQHPVTCLERSYFRQPGRDGNGKRDAVSHIMSARGSALRHTLEHDSMNIVRILHDAGPIYGRNNCPDPVNALNSCKIGRFTFYRRRFVKNIHIRRGDLNVTGKG